MLLPFFHEIGISSPKSIFLLAVFGIELSILLTEPFFAMTLPISLNQMIVLIEMNYNLTVKPYHLNTQSVGL